MARRLPPAVVAVVFGVVLAGALASCGGAGRGTPPAVTGAASASGLPAGVDVAIERVVDGDTIIVTGHVRVRLIGVDTPETVDPNRPVGCYGHEASAFTTSLLPKGTPVRLVGDVEQQDKYGRTLAYVYRRSDGLFVNAELVRRGYANVLTIPPDVAHADEFVALAAKARTTNLGLWAACASPP